MDQLEKERLEHNKIYDQQQAWLLEHPLTWERYYGHMCRPPHQGGTLYGLDHQIFLDYLLALLEQYGRKDLRILDYGCGTGALAIALASRGYHCTGFDLSDKGIEIAQLAAAHSGVKDRTEFLVANAQDLPFADDSFDLVIGKAVLHHTIKYVGTEQELYRILKRDGRAIFFEGAATNPFISLARRFTLEEALGDVPLTIKRVTDYAQAFQKQTIQGYFFLYMLKRLGYYSADESLADLGRNRIGKSGLFRGFLKVCLAFDHYVINRRFTSLCGRYLIELQK